MTFSVPGYRVEQLLGSGSEGQVWAAHAVESGERVAIKRIVTGSPAAADAGRAEAALLSALDHPSLIRLRAYLPLDGEAALVMELAEAGSLIELLGRRHHLSPAEVVATISPVAAALAYAHEQGVLHADVSAANILFTAAGQPKLADLGIARLLASRAARIGTPAYLDPAVAAGAAPGAASDIFALGAVALHALTGSGPWQLPGAPPASVEQVLAIAAAGRVEPLSDRLVAASPELAAVLARALHHEPHRRGTAAELALDLRAALRPVPVVLTGGRILSKVGRHSVEGRAREAVAGWPAPTDRPPAELTHVSRPQVRAGANDVSGAAGDGADGRSPTLTLTLTRLLAAVRRRAGWGPPTGGTRLPTGGRWLRAINRRPRVFERRAGSQRLRPGPLSIAVVTVGVMTGMLLTGRLPALVGGPSQQGPTARAAGVPDRSASGQAADRSASSQVPARPPSVQPAGQPASRPGDAAAVLAALDRQRAAAYAQRDPALLQRVYGAPALLSRDSAELLTIVPAGCRLPGLHTSYRLLDLVVIENRLQILVVAALSGGVLSCPGLPDRQLKAVAPVRLRLLLTDTGDGYRIASETVQPG